MHRIHTVRNRRLFEMFVGLSDSLRKLFPPLNRALFDRGMPDSVITEPHGSILLWSQLDLLIVGLELGWEMASLLLELLLDQGLLYGEGRRFQVPSLPYEFGHLWVMALLMSLIRNENLSLSRWSSICCHGNLLWHHVVSIRTKVSSARSTLLTRLRPDVLIYMAFFLLTGLQNNTSPFLLTTYVR